VEWKLASHFSYVSTMRIAAHHQIRSNTVVAGIASPDALIKTKEMSEAAYQRLLVKYPFILSGVFASVQSHQIVTAHGSAA
jgi:hypothetical protein